MIIRRSGGEPDLILDFQDQLYFTAPPQNNTGGTGIVTYKFLVLNGPCSTALTPYQEVASGFDNEKFSGDFGTSLPRLTSGESPCALATARLSTRMKPSLWCRGRTASAPRLLRSEPQRRFHTRRERAARHHGQPLLRPQRRRPARLRRHLHRPPTSPPSAMPAGPRWPSSGAAGIPTTSLGENDAAAVLGAATLTEPESDIELAQRLFARLNEKDQTFGRALMEAKKDLAKEQPGRIDVLRGWTLLGDPTQKVRQ